jgi:hypothetical protein
MPSGIHTFDDTGQPLLLLKMGPMSLSSEIISNYICFANVLFNLATMACVAIFCALLILVTEEMKIRKRRQASKRSCGKGPHDDIEINSVRMVTRPTRAHIPAFFVIRQKKHHHSR